MTLSRLLFIALATLVGGWLWASGEVPCVCPQVTCDECTVESGIDFYTEPCGPGGASVRSCARPSCVPKVSPPETCRKPSEQTSTLPRPSQTTTAVGASSKEWGTVLVVKGSVSVVRSDGVKSQVVEGTKLHVTDRIFVDNDAKALVETVENNRIHLHEATELKVESHQSSTSQTPSQTALELIRGKIRSQVRERHSKGLQGSYKVRTRGVVAGVRGTDFVVTFDNAKRPTTWIQMLEGQVRAEAEPSFGGAEVQLITKEQVQFILQGQEGYFTAVKKMSDAEWRRLDEKSDVTRIAKVRSPASEQSRSPICTSPQGRLNDCAWVCLNNPKKAKTCQTHTGKASCVRLRCNANGEWAEETRLPASVSHKCGLDPQVATCDY